MTAIWVIDWELGDEAAVVTVGDHLDWIVCEPDATTPRLRDHRIDLHMSPERAWGYGHDVQSVIGTVETVEAVMLDLRRLPGLRGSESVRGSEAFVSARSTHERWWDMCGGHTLEGWVITVAGAVVAPAVASDDRSPWHAGLGPMPSSMPPLPTTPRWDVAPRPEDLARLRPGRTSFVSWSAEPPPASVCQHPSHRR